MTEPKIKAVFFDFMGTCLDWHSSVVRSLPSSIPEDDRSEFALEWRRRYFIENNQRFKQGLSPEDIDVTLARVLETVLPDFPTCSAAIDSEVKRQMIQAWHTQPAWPEVNKAIQSLRDDLGLEVFVHANGTTRLQLDLARSSGLNFNMMFSSQLLGAYKPSPHAYMKALELVKFEPQEVVLVAAHAYDLRGAQSCGMKGVYVHRWTDDVDEDMTTVKTEFDAFLDGMEGLPRKPSAPPVRVEEIIRKKKEADAEAAKPKFIPKAERERRALEERCKEVDAMAKYSSRFWRDI